MLARQEVGRHTCRRSGAPVGDDTDAVGVVSPGEGLDDVDLRLRDGRNKEGCSLGVEILASVTGQGYRARENTVVLVRETGLEVHQEGSIHVLGVVSLVSMQG